MSRTSASLAIAVAAVCSLGWPEEPAAANPHGEREEAAGVALHGGLGLPEFAHGELGYYVTPGVLVEAQYKYYILDHLVGIGATGRIFNDSAFGRPGPHSLLLSGSALINPTLERIQLEGGGATTAAGLGIYVGWQWLATSGFSFRVLGGVIVGEDDGLAAGLVPLQFGFGWVF